MPGEAAASRSDSCSSRGWLTIGAGGGAAGYQGGRWTRACKSSPKTLNLYLTKTSCVISASTFKHSIIQKCCYDGAFKHEESCEQRAAKITIGPRCSAAFSQCCKLADKLRKETTVIPLSIGRDFPRKRSCFVCSTVRGCRAESVLPLEEVLPNLV